MMKKLSAISYQLSARAQLPLAVSRSPRRSFTLTELMVAVVVLLVVIIATSKIFGTASKIVGMGQGSASMMTEAAAIEQQFRRDIAKLTPEGFFVIHGVAVPNNINSAAGGPLLNANLAPTAILRADQLLFFTNGVDTIQNYRMNANVQTPENMAQGTVSRIYWGPGFQLAEGGAVSIVDPTTNQASAFDPNQFVTPWQRGTVNMSRVFFSNIAGAGTGGGGNNIYSTTAGTPINGTQPEARHWTLSRQPVSLVDDDQALGNTNSKTVFEDNVTTARSIFINSFNSNALPWGFSQEIRCGRVDAAATQLNDIRKWVVRNGVNQRVWNNPALILPLSDQRHIMTSAVYYPRAERNAPGMHRIDQALTNHTIASACSSFRIDWTYNDGDGFSRNPNDVNAPYLGVIINPRREHPWFGLRQPAPVGVYPNGVGNFADPVFQVAAQFVPAQTIYTSWPPPPPPATGNMGSIEDTTTTAGVTHYWATFGYNQAQPLNNVLTSPLYNHPDATIGYTPFPSAIRVTMTLHDPEGRLENGREFQFVVDLPRVFK